MGGDSPGASTGDSSTSAGNAGRSLRDVWADDGRTPGVSPSSDDASVADAYDDGADEPAEHDSTAQEPAASDATKAGGFGGVAGLEDLSTVKKSPGCGMAPPQADAMWHPYSLSTPTTRIGPLMRTYYLKLPANYDRSKAYRLIYQGTNCGGCPTCVMPFDTVAGAEGVIQVALERKDGVHMTCFDDQDPNSIEFPFIEAVDVDLRQKICFDEHRVFINGHSSGSWLTEEVGCVYGSAPQPGPNPPGGPLLIRAIAPHSGGLPAGPPGTPCNNFPTPGMWTHNHDDPLNSFQGTVRAIDRALKVNGCMGSYGNSPTAAYPATGTNDTCHIYTSCPKEFPVILCDPATGGHEGNKFYQANWQFFLTF
jgi:poly(3-hydroxybutyrate) depolymerase